MLNGDNPKPRYTSIEGFVTRDEMIVYTSKVIDISERQARHDERLDAIEKFSEKMSSDVSAKFETIQKTLEGLVKNKSMTEWVHRGLFGICGFLLMDIFGHFSAVIGWLNSFLNHG